VTTLLQFSTILIDLVSYCLGDGSVRAIACWNDDDRSPLSALERAAGYLRLVSLRCNVRRLAAKVGRSPKHVSAHLALLELPERAQFAVDAGELSLADAAALAKAKDEPELVEEILAMPG
jgi:ParB/RepB/Spo0J family partition protein